MQASLSSTKSFLSSRGKLKSLHRRKTSADSNSTQSTQSSYRPESRSRAAPDPYPLDSEEKLSNYTQARTIQDRRADTKRQNSTDHELDDPSSTTAQWNKASYDQFTAAQSEKQFVPATEQETSEPRTSEETMKEVGIQLQAPIQPFKGLDYPTDLGSNKRLIDDDILKTAFGITLSRGGSTEGIKKDAIGNELVKIQVPKGQGTDDVFEMEVPLQLVQDRTPELEVTIPPRRPRRPGDSQFNGGLSPIPQSAVSMLSPESSYGPPAHVSIVSPVEAVESPKPRRPFSTASIEGMTKSGTEKKHVAPPIASANSMSSAGTTDIKSPWYSQGQESPRSSMSSVRSETGGSKIPVEYQNGSVDASSSRLDTTSLYHAALGSRSTRNTSPAQHQTRTPQIQQSPQRPMIHRTSSESSLRSNYTSRSAAGPANVNKPLPPEPKRLSTISSVPSEGSSPSRSSMVTVRQAPPPPPPPPSSGPAPQATTNLRAPDVGRLSSNRSSSSGASLRSKYTPKDLDALDDAFLSRNAPPTKANNQRSPTTGNSHISSALQLSNHEHGRTRDRLGSISEEPGSGRKGSNASDVLQVSRGPMRMLPTRKAPQPPQSSKTPRSNTLSPTSISAITLDPPRLAKRSQSSTHIGSQFRENADVPQVPQRSTTLMVGSSSKADRILGKTADEGRAPNRPDLSFNAYNWTNTESPHSLSQPSSHMSSRDELNSAELERSPADAHFYEIQKRLELLSPKDDPSDTFQTFQHRPMPATRSSEALRPEDADRLARDLSSNALRSEEDEAVVDDDEESDAEDMPPSRYRQHPRPQTFIAELEAPYTLPPVITRASPAPIELEGSAIPQIAELGLPSPKAPQIAFLDMSIPAPPPEPNRFESAPGIVSAKRGRVDKANPLSSQSGKSRSMHSQGSVRVRSLASLAASEIPEMYAHLPSGSQTNSLHPSITSMSPEEIEMLVTAETAERVLLHILESLDNWGDLFSAARVSRGFYRTFKRHELHLLKLSLGKMSMAAWELREMSVPHDGLEHGGRGYTPELYFQNYVRDLMTMVELKALILDHCKSFLRQDTIQGLAGETHRSGAIDEAFWRIWTFCRIFGCGKNREDDILGQMDWLRGGILAKQSSGTKALAMEDQSSNNSVLFNPPRGFAIGNGPNGLSSEELYDMFELWTCLGVLLQGFQHEKEKAREVGIFDNSDIPRGEHDRESQLIEEWTFHLLASAPSTILDVVSATEPTAARFSKAQAKGYTKWHPAPEGSSKSMFLKEAVTRVYGEKMEIERPLATSPRSFSNLPQVVSPSLTSASTPDPTDSRQRIQAYGDEIRSKKQEPSYSKLPVSPDRPMSDFDHVVGRLETTESVKSKEAESPTSSKAPSLAQRFSRRKPKPKIPLGFTRENSTESLPTSGNAFHTKPNVGNNIGERIASLRQKVSGHESPYSGAGGKRKQGIHISSPLQGSLEKIPAPPEANNFTPGKRSEGGNPIDTFIDQLVDMGYEEGLARSVLMESKNGDRFDLDKAIKTLKKKQKRAERLERLDKMG